MGKSNKNNNNNKSSYIPTQEFVDKFTEALIHITRKMLIGLEYHQKDFTAKVLKPEVPGGDLEGNLRSTQSTSSTTTPIGTSPPNDITQSEVQNKKSKITRLTLTNNIVHDSQQGQVRTIMIYDIPTAWSHDLILEKLKSWGQVLEISFKPQHKYQSVWTKMILQPLIDTDFVMRTWWQQLDEKITMRWFPGFWKLKD
ncbi:hypothetical protein RhiirA4_419516 [Rhizophagus irregularis]|uniref:RRM domain-containing protein n=1 Tax=Rhizophagus irregularis TaxID=588596 RepID=A0A2I1GEI2_9GLOM|nr:hypothetical protein RhiirA4_419516 [Rhizophagus irregularis]